MGARQRIFNHEAAAALLLIALQDGAARNHDEIAFKMIDIHEGLAETWSEHGGVRTSVARYCYNHDWVAVEGSKYRITLQGFKYLHEFTNDLMVTRFRGRAQEFADESHRRKRKPNRRRTLNKRVFIGDGGLDAVIETAS